MLPKITPTSRVADRGERGEREESVMHEKIQIWLFQMLKLITKTQHPETHLLDFKFTCAEIQ